MKIKNLVVFAVFATLAVSIMCPFSSATTTDGVITKLNELKAMIGDVVKNYPTILTYNTPRQENALYNKIDAVIKMVEGDYNYMGAIKKLENDIAPKLNICETARARAQSWLSDDPELREVVEEFAGACQAKINDILTALQRLMNN